jgi:DNA-directed RNA polymerase subunit L
MVEEITVKVTADTTQFTEALEQAIAKVNELEQAFKDCVETAAKTAAAVAKE